MSIDEQLVNFAVNPPLVVREECMRAPTKDYHRPGDICYMKSFGFRDWSRRQTQETVQSRWFAELRHREMMRVCYGAD